jgi:hypothetical protein
VAPDVLPQEILIAVAIYTVCVIAFSLLLFAYGKWFLRMTWIVICYVFLILTWPFRKIYQLLHQLRFSWMYSQKASHIGDTVVVQLEGALFKDYGGWYVLSKDRTTKMYFQMHPDVAPLFPQENVEITSKKDLRKKIEDALKDMPGHKLFQQEAVEEKVVERSLPSSIMTEIVSFKKGAVATSILGISVVIDDKKARLSSFIGPATRIYHPKTPDSHSGLLMAAHVYDMFKAKSENIALVNYENKYTIYSKAWKVLFLFS